MKTCWKKLEASIRYWDLEILPSCSRSSNFSAGSSWSAGTSPVNTYVLSYGSREQSHTKPCPFCTYQGP